MYKLRKTIVMYKDEGTGITGSVKITSDQPVVALEVFTNMVSGAIAGLPGQ